MTTIWKLLVIVLVLSVEESFGQTTSILYAIASKDGSVSATCSQELKLLKDAIGRKEVWGMKGK